MEDQQPFSSSFGELLKSYRKRTRLTQKQLARQFGLTPRAYRRDRSSRAGF